MKHISKFALLLVLMGGIAMAGTIGGKAPKDTVVYVTAAPGAKFLTPQHNFIVNQKSMHFQPHVLVVPVGATVVFENQDAEPHNVMWPSLGGDKKMGRNMGTFPPGKSVSFKFEHPGVVPVLCNVHPEMSAYIVVTPTPYFSVAGGNGTFSIDNVPDGEYQLTAWREGKKTESKTVTVSNGDGTADFTAK